MPEVLSDSSCLIVLDNIGMLWVLQKLYGSVCVSEEVAEEFGKELEPWISVRRVHNRNYVNMLRNVVDLGEASIIALSFECESKLLILDDLKARKLAENLGRTYTGVLGILLRAKQEKIISSVRDVLRKLSGANFRISTALEHKILTLAGEETL